MKFKKIVVFLGIAILVVVLVLRGIPFFVNLYLNSHADEIVGDLITRTNDFSGHKVRFGKVKLDYDYRGTFLELDSVAIFPDENFPESRVKIQLLADRILLSGLRWKDLLLNNTVILDSAELRRVKIQSLSPALDSLNLKSNQGISRKTGRDYKSISVNNVQLSDFSIENKDVDTDSTRFEIEGLTVIAQKFTLTSKDLEEPDALFDVEAIEGKIVHSSIHFNQYRNQLNAENLMFSMKERSLSIENVSLDNKLPKYEYIQEFDKETDWVEIEQAALEMKNMNYDAFFRKGIIESEKLFAKDWRIVVFRDKRKPDNTLKRPKMIQKIIGGIPKPVHVDMVRLENGYVEYIERPDNESPIAGKVFFNQINAEIINITNIPEMLEMHNEMTLRADARIMDKGKVDLNVVYYLQDSTGGFTLKGNVRNLEAPAMNAMLRPATQVEARTGIIDDLAFNIKGDDIEGYGEVVMKYHDLAIDIRGKSFNKPQNIFQKIGSFLTNKLIIPSDNPNKKGQLKKGEVYFKRDQSKFIFNYWWKLVLSGMQSTLTGQDEEKLRKKTEQKE